jgi:hypothetical protein
LIKVKNVTSNPPWKDWNLSKIGVTEEKKVNDLQVSCVEEGKKWVCAKQPGCLELLIKFAKQEKETWNLFRKILDETVGKSFFLFFISF